MILDLKIPEAPAEGKFLPGFWINLTLLGNGPEDYRARALVSSFIRLVEAANSQYVQGKLHVERFWSTHDSIALSSLTLGGSYFENCVNSLHRAAGCAERVRTGPFVPQQVRNIFKPCPLFLRPATLDPMNELRNTIQHMRDAVLSGEIPAGTPFMLTPGGSETPVEGDEPGQTLKTIDRLEIGALSVKFSSLHSWLQSAGRIAEKIAALNTLA